MSGNALACRRCGARTVSTLSVTVAVDLLRKSGEFPVSKEELDDAATTVYEGI
jgi:hypothetical protein